MILVISPKNAYASRRLLEEARVRSPAMEIMPAEDLAEVGSKVDIKKFKVLYIRNPYVKENPRFINAVIKLAKKFKAAGKKVVDAEIARGNLGLGKMADYKKLKRANIAVPLTTLFHLPELQRKSLQAGGRPPSSHTGLRRINEKVWFPKVVKWVFGMKGKGVFLIKSKKDLSQIPSSIPKKELILQEYIKADFEYKVITVGYKSLPVVLRFKISNSGFRINYASPKVLRLEEKSVKKVVKFAEQASRALGRELAKVDILQKGDQLFVLEVNRFPGFKSFENLTGYNVAREFLKYLQK